MYLSFFRIETYSRDRRCPWMEKVKTFAMQGSAVDLNNGNTFVASIFIDLMA